MKAKKRRKIKKVALVLGSGGARGFAHIGAIQALEERGYKIKAISGASAGAIIGGLFAAGRLEEYTKWARQISRMTVWRLIDFSISAKGVMRGHRIFEELAKYIGGIQIEDLKIAFTAVATDLDSGQEVWINKGDIVEAIRASSTIPTVMQPYNIYGRTLVDGGVLNPTPIEPLLNLRKKNLLVVVNLNATTDINPNYKEEETGTIINSSTRRLQKDKWLDKLPKVNGIRASLNYLGIINKSTDLMMCKITDYTLNEHKPDIIINIPKDACAAFEFHRSNEMIKLGKEICNAELDKFLKIKPKEPDQVTTSTLTNIKGAIVSLLPSSIKDRL